MKFLQRASFLDVALCVSAPAKKNPEGSAFGAGVNAMSGSPQRWDGEEGLKHMIGLSSNFVI